MKLAEWIAAQRLSRNEAAMRLGLSRSYLTEIRQGKKAPSLMVAERIYKETGGLVNYSDLVITDQPL
jgi:transcriptional regulator with XRE-family HTH domain